MAFLVCATVWSWGVLVYNQQDDPLYDISAIGDGVAYRKSTMLATCSRTRNDLCHVQTYLEKCPDASALLEMCQDPGHLTGDPDIYTLEELVAVRDGTYLLALNALKRACIDHITECVR